MLGDRVRALSILVVNLSQARHLDDFIEDTCIIYLSPRLTDDKSRLEFQCDYMPRVSSHVERIQKQTGLRISVIITYVDVFGFASFAPRFEDCDVPIVAIVGDSHHGKGAIRKVDCYLRKNRIEHICLKQTKGQEPLFRSLGYKVFCFPVYLVKPTYLLPTAEFSPIIAAYGSDSPYHFRRSIILRKLQSVGLPVATGRINRNDMFTAFNHAAITLNIPLNSDVNYRFHESIAAGACLLTEELGPIAARFELMQSGLHYESFSSFKGLIEQCRFLMSSRSTNYRMRVDAHSQLKIGIAGTAKMFTGLVGSLSGTSRPSECHSASSNTSDARVNAYERVQEAARHSLVSPSANQTVSKRVPWPETFNLYDYSDITTTIK